MMNAHCRMFTNLPGQTCPLCQTAITPNVGHSCSIADSPKPPAKSRGKGKSLVGLMIPERRS